MGQTNASGTRSTGTGATAAVADATANPTVAGTASYGLVWNGSTWDRVREAQTTTYAGVTGIQAVGLVGYNSDATATWRGILSDPNGGLVTVPQHTTVTTWTCASASDGTTVDMGYLQMITVQVTNLSGSFV